MFSFLSASLFTLRPLRETPPSIPARFAPGKRRLRPQRRRILVVSEKEKVTLDEPVDAAGRVDGAEPVQPQFLGNDLPCLCRVRERKRAAARPLRQPLDRGKGLRALE